MTSFVIDFETGSRVSLKDTNSRVYSEHPTTFIRCMAYCQPGDTVRVESIVPDGDIFPYPFEDYEDLQIYAFNAAFEFEVWNNLCVKRYGWPPIEIENVYCIQAIAAYYGYPRSLEDCATFFGTEKDVEGQRLMLQFAKPIKKTKPRGALLYDGKDFLGSDHPDFPKVVDYCQQDVVAEHAILKSLGDLPASIRRRWLDLHAVNVEGVPIDAIFCKTGDAIFRPALEKLNDKMSELTEGVVTTINQRNRILKFLEGENIFLDNLQKQTVYDNRKKHPLLFLRYLGGSTVPYKYQAALNHVSPDGRCRYQYKFFGAGPGRTSAVGVQFQNLFKHRSTPDHAVIDALANGDRDTFSLLVGENEIQTLAQYVRSMVVAPDDYQLICCDLSQIEARIVFYLAGENVNFNGLYERMAAEIYKVPESSIGKESQERQVGKATVLGAGFGMWKHTFLSQLRDKFGVQDATEDFAEQAIETFRRSFPRLPKLWRSLKNCATMAYSTKSKNPIYAGKYLSFRFEEPNSLVLSLPSGRNIYYRNVRQFDEKTLCYTGHKGTIKMTSPILVENPTQALAADIFAGHKAEIQSDLRRIIMETHDEVVILAKKGVDKCEVEDIMRVPPVWAKELVLDCEASCKHRYFE